MPLLHLLMMLIMSIFVFILIWISSILAYLLNLITTKTPQPYHFKEIKLLFDYIKNDP